MRSILTGVVALLGAAGICSAPEAQTLRVMKSLDAPHYDGARTTWSPTSDIVNMFQDTLVAMDWDGKTPIPYLAKSWNMLTISSSIPSSSATTSLSAAARSSLPRT